MSHTEAPADHSPTAMATIAWSDNRRHAAFDTWLSLIATPHGLDAGSLRLASADASFRRYLRIDSLHGTRIIMDAPPDKEDCRPFVHVAELMAQAELRVPQVLAWDQTQGFLLLSDLGPCTMMQAINREQPQANLGLYLDAVDALVSWQKASQPGLLPAYDEALLQRELGLFPQWYLQQHRGITLDAKKTETLHNSFALIVRENLSWPQVYVHRDFMPRNLMMPAQTGEQADRRLGVLDFQDAVHGPITYDIASLMRDAFLSWDEEFVLDVTIRYWEKARAAGLAVGDDFGLFYRGVEWMGLQRHLKIAGIFARLTLRDGKPQYLADTPRFIGYIRAACGRYGELRPLLRLIEAVEGIQAQGGYAFGRV